MFINKFNKLIRNKWIWGIFAVVACALLGMSDFLRGGGGRSANAAGTIGGKPVSYDELRIARMAVRIESALPYAPNISEAESEHRAWLFVAAARTAAAEGLRVSEQELLDHIATLFRDPRTQTFDAAQYENLVNEVFGCSTVEFEESDRLFLLVEKVRSAHSLANWVSEPVADAQSRSLTDRCTVRTVLMTNAYENAEVELTDERLASFYENEKFRYSEPTRARVRYVRFAIADYAGKVKDPTEDELRYLYDDDPFRYRGEVDGVTTNLSFEAARPQVEEEFRKNQAVADAKEAAETFAEAFYVDTRHRKESEAALLDPAFFEARAAAAGLAVSTTAYFAASAPVPGIDADVGDAFSEEAFGLDPSNAYDAYGEVIAGKDSVYVIAFGDVVPEHIPPYEEVADRVRDDAIARERESLFTREFEQVFKKFEVAAKESSVDEAAAGLGLTISTNLVVSPTTAALPGPRGIWLHDLASLAKGSWSTMRHIPEGAVLLYMVDREEGEASTRNYSRDRLIENDHARIAQTLADSWMAANFSALKPDIPGYGDDDEE